MLRLSTHFFLFFSYFFFSSKILTSECFPLPGSRAVEARVSEESPKTEDDCMGNERPCKELSLELALDEVEASARKPRKWGFKGAQTSSRSKSKPGIKEHNIIVYNATILDFPLLVLVKSIYVLLLLYVTV